MKSSPHVTVHTLMQCHPETDVVILTPGHISRAC